MANENRRTELHELTMPESTDIVPYDFEDIFNQQISDLKDTVSTLSLSDVSAKKRMILLFRNCTDWCFKDMFKNYRRLIVEELCKFGFVKHLTRFLKELDKSDLLKLSASLSDVLKAVRNLSNVSSTFGTELAENGAIPILLDLLKHDDLIPKNLTDSDHWGIVNSILPILGNIARLCPDSRQTFRENNAVELLSDYSLKIAKKSLKADCKLTVSFLITDDEVRVIEDTCDTLQFLVNCLEDALDSNDKHCASKYSLAELLLGLNNLALNDRNKVRIVECGGLQLLSRVTDLSTHAISILAANVTWKLAFIEENRPKIIAETKLIKALKSWHTSENHMLKEASTGALMVTYDGKLDAAGIHTTNVVGNKQTCPHVMLSYQWEVQPLMIKLKEKLQQAGYNIWMDVDKMEGDILEAMANAVENASILIVAVSKKYKDSNSCRTEATYAYKNSKPIIPLIVEADYEADGWLGALIGTKMYYKVTSNSSIDTEYEKIQKEIGTRGLSEDVIVGLPVNETATSSQKSNSIDSVESGVKKHVSSWTKDEVKTWLTENKMAELTTCMNEVDGELLVQVIKLSNKVPEFYYSQLKSDFNMNFIQILKFDNSLEKLKI